MAAYTRDLRAIADLQRSERILPPLWQRWLERFASRVRAHSKWRAAMVFRKHQLMLRAMRGWKAYVARQRIYYRNNGALAV